MALHQVTNSEVRHWTKGCLAIRLLKDGLTSYVKSEIEHQYAVVVKTIKTRSKISAFSCSSCNLQNLLPYHACSERETPSCSQKPSNMCNCAKKHGKRKCPQGGACSLMYDYTIKEHFHSSPTFQNSDLRKWSTNNWEYAKCFISGSGKFGVTDVFDTDSAGLLSICLNNHSIRSQFEVSILEQAIQVRNDIFHSGSHQLQNDVVQGYIDMFLAVLRQPPLLCNHEAKDAVMKLASMRDQDFVIALRDTVLMHKETLTIVVAEINEIIKSLDEIGQGPQPSITMSNDKVLCHEEQKTMKSFNDRLAVLYAIEQKHTKMLEEHRSHAAEIQASVDSITTEIQHLHKKLEDQGATLTSVNQNTTETNANVKIIAQDLKDLKDLMEQINARERNTVPIPVLRMEVSSQNISNDDARKFHQIVVDGSNINVSDEQWRRIVKEFQIAKNGIANESGVNSREVTETRFECIAMYIQCWTLNGILKLCEDCLSGKLSEIFKPVERELRKIEGFRFVTLDAIIYKNDLVRCMQLIVRRIQRVSKEQYDSYDTHLQFTKFESSDTKMSSNENKDGDENHDKYSNTKVTYSTETHEEELYSADGKDALLEMASDAEFKTPKTPSDNKDIRVSRSSVHSSFDDPLSWAPTSTTGRTSTDRQQANTSDVNDDNCLQSVVENFGHEFEVFSDENTCIVLKTPHTVESSGKIFCHTSVFEIRTQVDMRSIRLRNKDTGTNFRLINVHKETWATEKPLTNAFEWINTSVINNPVDWNTYNVMVEFNTDVYGNYFVDIDFDLGYFCAHQRITVEPPRAATIHDIKESFEKLNCERWQRENTDLVELSPSSDEEKLNRRLLESYPLCNVMTLQTDVWYRPQDSHNIQSYKDRMNTFLYAEEVAQMKIVSRMNVICNMTPTDMLEGIDDFQTIHATEGQLFAKIYLENNLSIDSAVGRLVLQIDSVWLKGLNESSGIDTKRVYESSISHIEHDVIAVRLSQTCVRDLKLLNGRKCRVEIQMQLNRQAFCEMHHAVDNMESASFVYPLELEPVLPDECDGLRTLSFDGYGIKPCNEYQFATIRTIARPKIEGEPPILIVGPFGTGKTYTIAQAAIFTLQQPNTRILICTHSNSEADLYVTKYFHPLYMEGNEDTKPLRVYYEKRWPESVSQIVQKYCLMKYKAFRQPTKEEIDKHRIIITTLRSSKLVSRLASKGIFTHIMLDEAAQVLETELLIPLSLAGPGTKVVLAGDPMQIGPEVYSELGRKENFNVSMLERLNLTYALNTQYKVKLCQNYRTTSAIIDFMSELFYDCQLEATENPPPHPDVHALAFYVARGEDASLEMMNGYYNVAEVKEIVERVEELERTWPVRHWGHYDQSKICVIAPYRAQIVCLRSELKKRGFSKVNVERVNNVQGKEFKVTIISTVRTRREGMEDVEHVDLAFLSNPKFLVTAMTRAQSQVIVVGEPVVLSVIGECRNIWKRFIEVCHEHGSFHGLEWEEYRRQCVSAESKLNPEAPEFVPRVCID